MPFTHEKVPLGFSAAVPFGTELQIRPRSGLTLKKSIVAELGTIDSDYRGEICAIVINHSSVPYHIAIGERIAQMALCPVLTTTYKITDTLPATQRGDGGFGSTGRT